MKTSTRILVLLTLLLAALTLSSSASVLSFTFSDGSTVTAQGQLTGTYNSGVFTATSATGTYNGSGLSLVAPGVDPSFIYDNLVFLPGSPLNLDYQGLLFNVTGLGDVNLCGGSACAGFDGYTSISNFGSIVNTNVNVAFSLEQPGSGTTPEPATLGLCASAAATLAGTRRKALLSLLRKR